MYKITIEKQLANSNYEEELKTFNESNRYSWNSRDYLKPQEHFLQTILITELTQQEWESVKKAIITVK